MKMIKMKKNNNSSIEENKGKLVFKSKTPKKFTRLMIILFIDLLALTGIVAAVYLFVNVLMFIDYPNSLFPSIVYGLGMIVFVFFFYILTMLILREFWTYLMVYENGIEILVTHPLPFEYKREFISFENIISIKKEIDDFNIETLYIYVKNKEPYELDEFDLVKLGDIKDLIMTTRAKYLSTKKR